MLGRLGRRWKKALGFGELVMVVVPDGWPGPRRTSWQSHDLGLVTGLRATGPAPGRAVASLAGEAESSSTELQPQSMGEVDGRSSASGGGLAYPALTPRLA